jgi:hypothetical protein
MGVEQILGENSLAERHAHSVGVGVVHKDDDLRHGVTLTRHPEECN